MFQVVWGQTNNWNIPSVSSVISTADYMYRLNASFNFYMIHGGTNFEYWNGAGETEPVRISFSLNVYTKSFQDLTSYDYSAPLSEAGDPMPKYMAIRDWINSLPDWPYKPTGDIPASTRKSGYGTVGDALFACAKYNLRYNWNKLVPLSILSMFWWKRRRLAACIH
jgi:hypothetical protein